MCIIEYIYDKHIHNLVLCSEDIKVTTKLPSEYKVSLDNKTYNIPMVTLKLTG